MIASGWSLKYSALRGEKSNRRRRRCRTPESADSINPRDVSIVAIHISLNQADGGGGNRTRVRDKAVLVESRPPRDARVFAVLPRESRPKGQLAGFSRRRMAFEQPNPICRQPRK